MIVEIKHIREGKEKLKQSQIKIPSYKEELIDGRWRAIAKEGKFLKVDEEQQQILNFLLKYIPTLSDVATQRALYYTLRGTHPEWKYHKWELGSDEFYKVLTGWVMEKLQLLSNVTMQSFGIWAAPKGYIAGDGEIYTNRRKWVPLQAQPTLNFDLCDMDVKMITHARKVIHFEKDAGFSSIVTGDMPKYIEAVFSTAQGQLVEAANKFLADREKEGKQVYCVHDGDAYGVQMQLLYGKASKNNCYMPTEFYAQRVKRLGFFPRMAKELGLPSEKITSHEEEIFDNLKEMDEEQGTFAPDIKIFEKKKQKWEFQALNAIHEKAPHIYIIEGLKQFGDEIKYVPEADIVKAELKVRIKEETEEIVDKEIRAAVSEFIDTNVRPQITEEIKKNLKKEIADFSALTEKQLDILDNMNIQDLREAVKLKLVKQPQLYHNDAYRKVVSDILKQKFNISLKAEALIEIKEVKVDKDISISNPEIPDKPLTKEDICNAIEEKVLPQKKNRDTVVNRIRTAFEKQFSKPNIKW